MVRGWLFKRTTNGANGVSPLLTPFGHVDPEILGRLETGSQQEDLLLIAHAEASARQACVLTARIIHALSII